MYCLTSHHASSIANMQRYSNGIEHFNLFACLQQNTGSFIKAGAAECVTAHLVLRHPYRLVFSLPADFPVRKSPIAPSAFLSN